MKTPIPTYFNKIRVYLERTMQVFMSAAGIAGAASIGLDTHLIKSMVNTSRPPSYLISQFFHTGVDIRDNKALLCVHRPAQAKPSSQNDAKSL